ncbi:MAG: glutamine amidotransferase [Rhodanobacteraceae bacterium]
MRCLIIQTGTTLPAIRRNQGDFADWIRRDLDVAREHAPSVRVDLGETLPTPAHDTCVIVTGSAAMVSQRADWSERTANWLSDAVASGLPILGLCYGHQLLAQALGGKVGPNPRGREIGSVDITLLADAGEDPLFAEMPKVFRAQASHLESVIELPPSSRVLAQSRLEAYQAVRYAPLVWGVQFHPEFSCVAMRGYVEGRAEALLREGLDPTALCKDIAPAPEATRLLPRFARISEQAAQARQSG